MGMGRGGGGYQGGGGRGSIYSRMQQQAQSQRGGQGMPQRSAGLRAPVQAQGGYAQTQSPVNRGNPPPPQNMASQATAYERAQQPGAILDPAGPQGGGNAMQQQMQMQRAQAGAMRGAPNPTGSRMPMRGGGRGGRYGGMRR